MKTVYLLGAGASAEAGVPTSSEILSVAYRIYRGASVPESLKRLLDETARDALGKVFSFIGDYFHHGRLAPEVLPSPNTVLGVIDLHAQTGRPLWRSPEVSLDRIKLLELRRAVVLTILISLEHYRTFQERVPEAPYRSFIERLDPNDTVISLNQDYLLDANLWESKAAIDYGLGRFEVTRDETAIATPSKSVLLFKPHGSINWLRCPTCERLIVLREAGGIRSLEILAGRDLPASDRGRLCCAVDGQVGEPIIIAPTIFKPWRDPLMEHLLAAAAERVRDADRLVIIGCSLQESDMHLIAWLKESLARGQLELQVVNDNPNVLRHYQRLFGPDLEAFETPFSCYLEGV